MPDKTDNNGGGRRGEAAQALLKLVELVLRQAKALEKATDQLLLQAAALKQVIRSGAAADVTLSNLSRETSP